LFDSSQDIEIVPVTDSAAGSVVVDVHVTPASWLYIISIEEVLGLKPITAHVLSAKQLMDSIV